MVDRVELIKEFIGKIKSYYPELYINFDYDKELDEYEIWHNDPQLEFQDNEFKKLVGKIAQDIFFDNNIYNFSFGYDYYKTKEIENRNNGYSMKNTKVDTIEVFYSNIDKRLNYSNSIDFKISGGTMKLSGHSTELSSAKPYYANTMTSVGYDNIFNIYDGEVA